jgi:hypothetical protein
MAKNKTPADQLTSKELCEPVIEKQEDLLTHQKKGGRERRSWLMLLGAEGGEDSREVVEM